MNHVRMFGNGWIISIDNSGIFSGVFLILIVISKTTPNINIPSVPSKKCTMQFEYLANFTHRMSDFRHWIFECPMSNILLTSNSSKLPYILYGYMSTIGHFPEKFGNLIFCSSRVFIITYSNRGDVTTRLVKLNFINSLKENMHQNIYYRDMETDQKKY